jgi:3-mercaptopyruvate sulfurtransferase SseA
MRHFAGRTSILVALLLALLVALAACGSGTEEPPQNQDEVPRISPAQLKERLDAGEETLVVDARSAGEYDQRHIPGSISVPLNEVEARLDEFPRDQEIVFYCT